jgi:hypothetical protein
MDPKIEVILELIEKGKDSAQRASKYGNGMYSGHIMAQLARRSMAYLQDAEAKLKVLGGVPLLHVVPNAEPPSAPPAKAPSQPVATPPPSPLPELRVALSPPPEMRIQVKWEAIETPCPVCHEVSTLGLTATAQQGDGKAVIELLVCSECITQGTPKEVEGQESTELAPSPVEKLTDGEILR